MLKSWFPTLGRLRLTVQLLMLVVTVYGGNLFGYYAAEKISNALPALSCAYDQQDAAYCILIPTQHQIHHRIGEAMVRAQQLTVQMVLPLLMTFLSFFAFFFVLGKAFCGWVCPLGTLQELVGRVGRRFNVGLRRVEPGDLAPVHRLRPVKWLLLLGLVFVLPLLAGLGVAPHSLGNPYCDVCPSRIATTLLTGSTEQLALNIGDNVSFALGAAANTLFGFIVVGALAIRQPFCRICPLLALNALFQRLSPLRLVKKRHENCGKCRVCSEACPMDIPEIATEEGRRAFHEDCTLCGRCAEYCPQDGIIKLQWGPLALFSSRREYYKQRVQAELPDGTVKPIKFVNKVKTDA
ncbi:4Fe-4S ferredoxin [Denitratisoma sp. DHT3]|uniref:4Fe-4S binding protein n=1 Tax=Denitratisoma sp. DHT3 TaxID=1981880 RepID=UPI001198A357|nr:4Fe-4S binding protein [Denitratisoma sp. DHT3]QDX81860.1 4Fe-4S ferredoxin [Denitratisoma sp. DHT3]